MRTVAACAPARVSFAGGGTDLPEYADRFGGTVVSCSINRNAGVRVTPRLEGLELVALDSDSREVIPARSAARRLRAPILAEDNLLFAKAAAALYRLERGKIEVTSTVPAGRGLASSGSLAVALAAALRSFVGDPADPAAAAEDAFAMEAGLLARPVGRQDQYAAAFGGMNLIEIDRSGVKVSPLKVDLTDLESRLLLLSDGSSRSAVAPLREQRQRTMLDDPVTLEHLHALSSAAHAMRVFLESGDFDSAGDLLDQVWHRKKQLADRITNTTIDHAYQSAKNAGAIGAKLCGAGTAGTLLAWCSAGTRDDVRGVMETMGWKAMDFHLSNRGVRCDTIAASEEETGD